MDEGTTPRAAAVARAAADLAAAELDEDMRVWTAQQRDEYDGALLRYDRAAQALDERLPPSPPTIRAARLRAGLTQTQAAGLVFTTCRVWQQWESGRRRMHRAFWTLFRLRTGLAD